MTTFIYVVLALNAVLAVGEVVWLMSGRPRWFIHVHEFFKRLAEE